MLSGREGIARLGIHASDTGVYDRDGRFDEGKWEELLRKSGARDGVVTEAGILTMQSLNYCDCECTLTHAWATTIPTTVAVAITPYRHHRATRRHVRRVQRVNCSLGPCARPLCSLCCRVHTQHLKRRARRVDGRGL